MNVATTGPDTVIASGRAFARIGADGMLDGAGLRGVFADGVRLLRLAEVWRGDSEAQVPCAIALGERRAVVRFELDDVDQSDPVHLAVEVDGTDLVTLREGAAVGGARPNARVLLQVECHGGQLVDRDGIAFAPGPMDADGRPRTASWRWMPAAEGADGSTMWIELRLAWSFDETQPADLLPFAELEAAVVGARESWCADLPSIGGPPDLAAAVDAGIRQLALLRASSPEGPVLVETSADAPRMGHGAIIAAWMALPVDQSLAAAALRHVASAGGGAGPVSMDDAVDAVPLFLMLLAELTRWSGDESLARELRQPARRAVDWLQELVDRDSLGLIGTGHVRRLETQAFGVAAFRAAARLAKTAWSDDVMGSQWAGTARQLERRLVERWGHATDALGSSLGAVLWADAVSDPTMRAEAVRQLASPAVASGWGLRTMSTREATYDPSSPDHGGVSIAETAIGIAGVLRVDREAGSELARTFLDAVYALGAQLPASISGIARGARDTRPEPIGADAGPDARAAGASLLVLRALLGIEPDGTGANMVATSAAVPAWLAGTAWRGIAALGRTWDVTVDAQGRVDIAPTR